MCFPCYFDGNTEEKVLKKSIYTVRGKDGKFCLYFILDHFVFCLVRNVKMIFSIRVFFHGHWRFTGQQRKEWDILLFHSTTSTRSQTSSHLFPPFMWDGYDVFLIATLVFTRLLLWDLPSYWFIIWFTDDEMYVCILDDLILGLYYSNLKPGTGNLNLHRLSSLHYKQND